MSGSDLLHRPTGATGDGIVLSHGAGSDANAKILVALATALCDAGYLVLRIDLAFRKLGRPPGPATGALDRAAILEAAGHLRELGARRVILGGHSYGGRQSTMLAAENPNAADALLLLSYPLHPPKKPTDLRTAHFPALRTPALFVHGTRDPFGSPEEMAAALELIPAPHRLIEVQRAGHELAPVVREPAMLVEPIRGLLP